MINEQGTGSLLERRDHLEYFARQLRGVDRNVPMLARMFEKRMRRYRAMGYSVGDYDPPESVEDGYVIEHDENALRKLEEDDP